MWEGCKKGIHSDHENPEDGSSTFIREIVTRVHGVTTHKTTIWTVTAVKTLTYILIIQHNPSSCDNFLDPGIYFSILFSTTLKLCSFLRVRDHLPHSHETRGKIIVQIYWVLGLCPSSGILETRKHNLPETGSVSVLRWEGRHLLSWVP
jgi:hypothetical protein